MLEEKERGKSNQLTAGQQKGATHRIRVCVGLDHLTPFNQGAGRNASACVSSRADGGAACTSTWQLSPQAETSSEES